MPQPVSPWLVIYQGAKAHPRMVVSFFFGLAIALLIPNDAVTRLLFGWNAGCLLFIVLIFLMMARSTAGDIRHHALQEEAGRLAVLTIVVAAAIMILIAIVIEIYAAKELRGAERAFHLALAFATVIDSWLFVQITFTIQYAHEYHTEVKGRRGKPRGGLKFVGNDIPDYWDFLYFALTVGMTAQTSDTGVESRHMRRLTIVHGLISFIFTTAVIALTVNLGATILQ